MVEGPIEHERLEKFYKEDLRKLLSPNLYDPQILLDR